MSRPALGEAPPKYTGLTRAVLVALSLVLSMVLLPGLTTFAHATDKPRASADPSVAIESIDPAILTDEEEVTVTVNLSGIDDSLPTRILLFMQADPLRSFTAVESYIAGEGAQGWAAGELVLDEEERSRAAERTGATLRITVPVDDLPLWNPDAWGPYGFEVRVLGTGVATLGEVISDHSIMIWHPPGSSGSLAMNLLVPSSMAAEASTPPKGGTESGLTLALTPDEATVLAKDNGTSSGQKPEVVLLPVQNADLAMLASVGQDELYDLAVGSEHEPPLDESVQENLDVVKDVLVGSSGWMSARFLDVATGNVVLGPITSATGEDTHEAQTSPPAPLHSAKTRVTTEEGNSVWVIESWEEMSQLLSRESVTLSEFNLLQEVRSLSALAATQWRRTETSGAYNQPLPLWVRAPSTLPPSLLTSRLQAVLDVPWVTPTSLKGIIGSQEMFTVEELAGEATSVDFAAVSSLMAQLGDLVELALAVAAASPEGADIFTDQLSALLYPTAAGLTLDERTHRVREVIPQLEEAFDVIGVAPTGTVNVMSSKVDFPVTVSNTSPYPVDVEVGLQISDPRLQANEWAQITVPPAGTTIAQIPVTAVGSGDVSALVVAKTADGTILDASQEVNVRVRAGLEDALIWTIGGVAAVLFVVGLVRTLRKGRRRETRTIASNG